MKSPPPLPEPPEPGVVAIVGRPNVGKSALFNRLLGRRLAIVHEESGVTRDRLYATAHWAGRDMVLADTGGIVALDAAQPTDPLERETHRQTEQAIRDAAVAIVVVDSPAGPVPLDEEVVRRVRAAGVPAVIAANKCDAPAHDDAAQAFARFGLPVYPISALHNRGLAQLMDEVIRHLPATAPPPEAPALRVAIVGRPNVGKSSYLNRLLRAPRLVVTAAPGTTRDAVAIPFCIRGPAERRYLLVDTPGIRRPGQLRSAVEHFSLVRAEQAVRRADVVALMLDATAGPTAQDKRIAHAVLARHKGCLLLVNKWDLLPRTSHREYTAALHRAVPFLNWAPIAYVSARTGYNVRRSLELLDEVAAHIQTRCSTPVLNRVLSEAVTRVSPPLVRGRRFKVYYAVQTGVNPVRVTLFVNDPALLVPAYREYLVHCLRQTFELTGAPVILEARVRR